MLLFAQFNAFKETPVSQVTLCIFSNSDISRIRPTYCFYAEASISRAIKLTYWDIRDSACGTQIAPATHAVWDCRILSAWLTS